MIEVAQPQAGEGWGHLMTTPEYNGGDTLPPELAGQMDSLMALMPADSFLGIRQDGTPSALFQFQRFSPTEQMVHWANDGRVPLGVSLDVLTAYTSSTAQSDQTFLAFCRRPALVRLLASRGWTLRSHEDEPFMALMVCQPKN
ncbi:hypothetical protein ASF71_06765 [Deinococcus sp. Leaf326]|nr:hypothetical protein ASF71_06765 [Deinococcus sp. Leaf326]